MRGKLPKFMPDVPEVRADYTDYMGEIQAWDAGVGVIVERAAKRSANSTTRSSSSAATTACPACPAANATSTTTASPWP